MKNTNFSAVEGKQHTGPFQPVHLHEKLVMTVFCIIALIVFVIVLVVYAEPTPAGSAAESKVHKQTVGQADALSAGVDPAAQAGMVAAESTAKSGTDQAASVGSSSNSVAGNLQSGGGRITSSQAVQQSTEGKSSTQVAPTSTVTGAVNQVVNTLQTGLNPLGLRL